MFVLAGLVPAVYFNAYQRRSEQHNVPIFRNTVSTSGRPPSDRRLRRSKKDKGQTAVQKKGQSARMNRELPKVTRWRIEGAEKFAVATARLQEKLSHLKSWISYRFHACTHPCSRLGRQAAKRSKVESKLGATDRRKEAEAAAKSKAATKRRRSLEQNAAEDAEHAKLLG